MTRAVALCACLVATLALAVPARGGGDQEAESLAKAVLTARESEAGDLADKVKQLTHEELSTVLEAIRREYRALADSKGATTELAVVGTYEVDRQSLDETVLAHYRATLLRMEKVRPPTLARLAEIDADAARASKAAVDERYSPGNPMVLYIKADGTFEVDESVWRGQNIRRGTWTLKGEEVTFRIKSSDDVPVPPGMKFGAKILRWGRLAVPRSAFGSYKSETWVLVRRR